jgi:hypothetical protein
MAFLGSLTSLENHDLPVEQSPLQRPKSTSVLKFCGKTIKMRAFFTEFFEKTYLAEQNL